MVERCVPALLLALVLLLASPWDAARSQGDREAESGNLGAMLARVPAALPELEDYPKAVLSYADIAAQLAALDVEAPDAVDDQGMGDWFVATRVLPLPATAFSFMVEMREDYGFDLLQVDEALEIAEPPFSLTMFRGRFDPNAVRTALDVIGYTPLAGTDSVLSVRGDYEIDLGAPGQYAFASMNFAALLDDGTLAFAPARAIIEAVLDVQAGRVPAMSERADVAALLAHVPPGLASALLVDGQMLANRNALPPAPLDVDSGATPDIGAVAVATRTAGPRRLPAIALALLGRTAGGPLWRQEGATPMAVTQDGGPARVFAALLTHSPADAIVAAELIEERLANQSSREAERPFAEIFPERTVAAVLDEPVVVLELSLAAETNRGIWQNLLYEGDLGFLTW